MKLFAIMSGLVVAMVLVAWGSNTYESYAQERAFAQRNGQAKLARERKIEAFQQQHDAILTKVRALMARRDWDAASLEASRWRDVGGKDLAALEATIDGEKHKIFLAGEDARNKVALAERLEREKEEREADRRDRARRKHEGVRVGMTKDDVLKSSWGRPEHVNRSIYSWGTTEQWVYSSGNYLYFDGEKLTVIQNH